MTEKNYASLVIVMSEQALNGNSKITKNSSEVLHMGVDLLHMDMDVDVSQHNNVLLSPAKTLAGVGEGGAAANVAETRAVFRAGH